MASVLGQMIVSLLPLLIFLGLYLVFFIWGRYANKKIKENRLDDVLTAIDPYIDNYVRNDPNDRQVELRLQVKEGYNTKSASAWIILLPRTSFPTMFVDKLFFRNKDAFGLAANFQQKPRVVFEVIPYKKKSAIRRDFDYLVQIDDIDLKEEKIDDKFLIKCNRPRVVNQFTKSKIFKRILRNYPDELQWISVRTDSPHFEMKFDFTKETTDLLSLIKFCMVALKFFGRVTEKTQELPLPDIVVKKEKEKDSEKEKKKKEKEREQEKAREQREKEKLEKRKKRKKAREKRKKKRRRKFF